MVTCNEILTTIVYDTRVHVLLYSTYVKKKKASALRSRISSKVMLCVLCLPAVCDALRSGVRPVLSRGQHFPDFRGFSPGCPLRGALLSRRASSRSPDLTPAGGGPGRARVVSWGRAQSSKRSSFPVDGTALKSLHYSCQNHAVPLVHIYI